MLLYKSIFFVCYFHLPFVLLKQHLINLFEVGKNHFQSSSKRKQKGQNFFFFFAKNNRKIRFKLWYIILYGWRSHILVQDIVINIYRYYSVKCCYYLYEKYDCYDAVLLGLFLLLVLLYSD